MSKKYQCRLFFKSGTSSYWYVDALNRINLMVLF